MKAFSSDTASHAVDTNTKTPHGYTVVVQHRKDIGSPWVVRTYKRRALFFRRLISSDWFLDGDQAKTFARQLTADLTDGPDLIKNRKPGWTLRRPPH